MIFSVFRQKSLSFCLSICLAFVFGTGTASAQQVGPGCDPEFMKAIQDKAWMEAQREIMIAQTTIAKPDSVFSLGCFDHWASGLTISFGNGSNYGYSGKISSYGSSAFNHTHGGGHHTGSNSTISNCGAMMSLWNSARGADLDSPSRLLDTLKDISTYNRGNFPTPRVPVGFTPKLAKFYDPKVADKSVGANFDDMKLFAGVTAPFSQLVAPNNKCAKGIPTGVSIDVSGGARPEVICPNPGCVSDGLAAPKCCDYSGGNCSP